MRTRHIHRVWITFFAALAFITVQAMGDEQNNPRPMNAEHQMVMVLENMDAHDAAGLAKSIDPQLRVGVDRSSNSLVISGPESAVQAFLNVIRQLDGQDRRDDVSTATARDRSKFRPGTAGGNPRPCRRLRPRIGRESPTVAAGRSEHRRDATVHPR